MGDVEEGKHESHGDHTDGQIDQEDPAPTVKAQELVDTGKEASDDGTDHTGCAKDGQKETLVAGAVPGWNDVGDDGQREGEQTTRPHSLQGPVGSQFIHRCGKTRSKGTDNKNGDSRHKQGPAPKNVPEFAINRCRNSRGNQIRGSRPGLQGQAI